NYSFYDFLTLVGSLGMFLYGMKVMSEGLQKVAGDRLRGFLATMTKNRLMGLLTGVLITMLIQSSSATTVMVVSFVNAGLLTLAQSITVIMGANIGTTVTAWIISLFGFKFSISVVALPIMGLAIPLIFSSNGKRKSWGEFLVGFAFLFMGLDFLKGAVPDIKSNPEILSFLREYTQMGFSSTLLFLLIGTILTIVVQSSSATMAITLVMCSKGWISYEIAAAMVLGENIGTTITANLAALSANTSAKRAALSHLMFNVFGVIWVLILFRPFMALVGTVVTKLGGGDPHALMTLTANLSPADQALIESKEKLTDPSMLALREQFIAGQVSVSYALSLFHTLFNIINSFLMIWFVGVYVKVVSTLIKQKTSEEDFHLQFISTGLLSTGELSLMQARQEIQLYAKRTNKMFTIVRELMEQKPNSDEFIKTFTRIEKYEGICDRMELEIGSYLNQVAEGRLSNESKSAVRRMMTKISEIESVGDSCFHIARTINHKAKLNIEFTDEMLVNINKMFDITEKQLTQVITLMEKDDLATQADIDVLYNTENEINNLRSVLRRQNVEDVNNKLYTYQAGTHYMDIIVECEKLGDYVMNVVEAIKEKKRQAQAAKI
ncbi:MAG: Na/Pi cotransporter family protein, partial [Bacteroidales bacterium]